MKDKKLVSIIVPVYQAEKFIETCVDSICKQTYSNLEILLIDDGSMDRSLELCKNIAAGDTRIIIKHHDNCGVSFTRNYGLECARGDYIYFLDSDDTIKPNTIESLVNEINLTDGDICFCGYETIKKNEIKEFLLEKRKVVNIQEFKRKYFWELYERSILFNIGTKLFKRNIIEENHIRFHEDVIIYEDIRFCMEYLDYSKSVVLLNKALYIYNIENYCSITHQYKPEFWQSTFTFCNMLLQYTNTDNESLAKALSCSLYRAFLQECHNPFLCRKSFFLKLETYCFPILQRINTNNINWKTVSIDQKLTIRWLKQDNKGLLWILALLVARREKS